MLVSDPPPLEPEPKEGALVEVLWDALCVAEVLAREPVRSQDAGNWASHVLRAMHDAAQAIVYGKAAQAQRGELMGAASIEASEKFFRELAEIALAFRRTERHDHFAKFTKTKPYREALLHYMDKNKGMQIMESGPYNFTMQHFYGMAGLILSGTLLYPAIDQPEQDLAQKLHDGLGIDFLQRITSAEERVKRVLRIAGLPAKTIGNLLRGPQYTRDMRKRRAKKAAKSSF